MRLSSFQKSITLTMLVSIFTLSNCVHVKLTNKDHQQIHTIIENANKDFYLDSRIWYQDVQAEINGNQIILTGQAFYSTPIKGIARKLKKANLEYDLVDSITYLPEKSLGDLPYGIITKPYIMGRYKPVDHKQEGTEMLYGEPVRLIRQEGKYLQVQSAVGYLGYIPEKSLRRISQQEWNRYHIGKQAVFTNNDTLESGLVMLMGTRLPYLENGSLLMADGSELQYESDKYSVVDAAANPLRQDIIATAQEYLGLPYVWGGRSADGVDCSGFVMQSYSINNIYLPRDSDEIANTGRIVAYPGWFDAMLAGDIIFFVGSRRMITHTGIYMGDGKFIHSLGKGVQIQSLNPEDPDYSEGHVKRFAFAKRIFD